MELIEGFYAAEEKDNDFSLVCVNLQTKIMIRIFIL